MGDMEPSELDEWAASASAALGIAIEPGDVGRVLDLARDAAHGVARPAAPLTTFLAGIAVGRGETLEVAAATLARAIAAYEA
jgi:hypothetical protein